ncbi:DUF1996 domain-containing protein [Dactylosporangium sucinum]|uniref:DUF1996 domain-containing protein n=1 Tax=Dactylosporangium sucinum TaxID=1424081 RepID=A0A917U981_9ACTN|nr:DUF1996 domain-containing protein [Dactylosporangium sucinum]GGM63482.1 hypothetical protein GCM10007977_076380 [Dactylosporangium sucinum]
MVWVAVFTLVTTTGLWWVLRGNTAATSSPPDAAAAAPAAHQHEGQPAASDYVDILSVPAGRQAPQAGPNASTGSYRHDCGRNENGFYNPDNFIVVPGKQSGAHHMHDYLGNQSVDWRTTDESLAAATETSCRLGDLSSYFWPVLRDITQTGTDAAQVGGGKDGNHGRILPLAEARMEFLGNAQAKVVPMPLFLRLFTGNAKAITSKLKDARSQWGCAGFKDRYTEKYPLCPDGAVQRVIEYPSCWNGKDTRSNDVRSHTAFPDKDGRCPDGTRAVPKLVITLTYAAIPPGRSFALDAFPGEGRSPHTDHAGFANVMPEDLMALIVDCINDGRAC